MPKWKNNMNPPIVTLKYVKKMFTDRRPHTRAIANISLTIHQGEFFVFVGPSGCGKSTLLRLISGLDKDYEGDIRLQPGITQADMGFVFQQFALLPWLTVSQNIELNLIGRHIPKHEHASLVSRELKRFHLEKFAHSYPKELSGGLKQRVGIARALVANPKLIFMDEAFSELDSFTAEELRQEFLHIWKDTGATIIMVTHLIGEAIELSDRIAVVSPRPAHIKAIIHNPLPRPRPKRTPEYFALEDQVTALVAPPSDV
jgi:NitT/TauT family transport system ATP-binding protein